MVSKLFELALIEFQWQQRFWNSTSPCCCCCCCCSSLDHIFSCLAQTMSATAPDSFS